MYLSCIFWTLGYDTVYGFQDIHDDKKLGIKSTSIKFSKFPKLFLFICFFVSMTLQVITFILIEGSLLIIFVILLGFFLIFFKLFLLKLRSEKECNRFFIFNSYYGLMLTTTLLII